MSKQKPIAKLNGLNIIEHVKATQEMKHETFSYYHYDSEMFRAIKDHIATADRSKEKDCALLDLKKEEEIPWHRGTGPSIHFKDAIVHGDEYTDGKPKKYPFYTLQIEISFIYEEENHQDYPPEHFRKDEIRVPIELENNFTKEAFGKWIAKMHEQRSAERIKDGTKKLEELVKMYPKEAKKILKGLTS